MGKAQQKKKVQSVVESKTATTFPPILAEIVVEIQKGDLVVMAELYCGTILRWTGGAVSRHTNSYTFGVRLGSHLMLSHMT